MTSSHSGRCTRRLAIAAAAFSLAACHTRDRTPGADTSRIAAPESTVDTTSVAPAAWDDSYGDGLLVPSASPATALGVSPDTSVLGLDRGTVATLLGRDGHRDTVRIVASDDNADGCSGLPAWHLTGGSQRAWTVGFAGGDVTPLPADSLSQLSRADSTTIASAAIRLASGLPSRGYERFADLPFVPEAIWRVRDDADSLELDVVTLVRQVNQEAQPLEERTFLLIERRRGGDFVVAHAERSSGTEEQVETRDFLGAMRLGGQHALSIVIAHDYGTAVAYSLLQRGASGDWRVRWTSSRAAC